MEPFHWPEPASLELVAQQVIEETLAGLPSHLRLQAGPLPVTLLPIPEPELVADGVAEDTLGLFVGGEFGPGGDSPNPLPAQILLFLDNLWDFADGDWDRFRTEVRTTYLHELGHFLGLDEGELDARGLG